MRKCFSLYFVLLCNSHIAFESESHLSIFPAPYVTYSVFYVVSYEVLWLIVILIIHCRRM